MWCDEFRCVFTFEPHQSQYLASAWFIRLHLEQDNILPSADGTEGALSPTHTACSNTHTHTYIYISQKLSHSY